MLVHLWRPFDARQLLVVEDRQTLEHNPPVGFTAHFVAAADRRTSDEEIVLMEHIERSAVRRAKYKLIWAA